MSLNEQVPVLPRTSDVRRGYALGLRDGVKMAFDHIEGIEAVGEPYDGPMPEELRAYIKRARERM